MRFAWLMILGACGGDVTSYEDAGELCFRAHEVQSGVARLAADRAIDVVVSAPECLSSSCDVDRKFACEAVLQGQTIELTSTLRWTRKGDSCTDDCGLPAARCQLPALPAGSYTLKHGDHAEPLQIPGEIKACDPLLVGP